MCTNKERILWSRTTFLNIQCDAGLGDEWYISFNTYSSLPKPKIRTPKSALYLSSIYPLVCAGNCHVISGTGMLFLLDLRSQTSSVVFSIVRYINNSELFVNLTKRFLGMVLYYFQRSIIFKQLTACTSGMHKFTKSQEPFQNSRRQKGNVSSIVSTHTF